MSLISDSLNTYGQESLSNRAGQEHVVQPAQFGPLGMTKQKPDSLGSGSTPLDFLFDVQMQVSVELGRTEMSLREILGMRLGTVIELNRLAGESVDIFINGKLIARGEVVVIDDMFGVRVVDILSPYERINSLRGGND